MSIEEIPIKYLLYIMLYGGAAVAALLSGIYLFFRKGNAFAADVTPPVRLRRWAAAFFAVAFLSHLWWFPFYVYSGDINSVFYVVVAVTDTMGLLTTITGTLFSMLQDRKRPIWPVVTGAIPCAILYVLNIVYPGSNFITKAIIYILLLYVFFTIYMIYAVRQYGRWLRDNYADLEYKEVWVSHVLVIVILLLTISYGLDTGNLDISYIVQVVGLVLFFFLLWRVETLPQLENTSMEPEFLASDPETTQEPDIQTQAQHPLTIPANVIQQLLDERCVSTQLYLQHDLTLHQLAQAIGTNRSYLSQFFSTHGTTYNAYINDLRINHFVCLYREATAAQQSITAQQLASDSGYRSYSTFGLAFKQRMGQSVTAWMRETAK